MPALRKLDLSRDAPGCATGVYLGGRYSDELFAEFLDAPLLDGLEELVLPPPPTIELAEAMLTAPRLARIPRVRVPISFIPLDRARFAAALPQLEIEALYPHRRVAEVPEREAMAISVGDEGP